jgi:phosphonate transport system permease protein
VAVVISLRSVEVIPSSSTTRPEQMRDLLQRMWPIAWSHYPKGVHDALMETLPHREPRHHPRRA